MLEPCEGKLSRMVLRGERGSNAPDLPGLSSLLWDTRHWIKCFFRIAEQSVDILCQSTCIFHYRVLQCVIERLASTEKNTKSDIIKEALREYIASHRKWNTSYKSGQDLFGIVSSDDSTRSKTYKKRVKDKLSEKHAH